MLQKIRQPRIQSECFISIKHSNKSEPKKSENVEIKIEVNSEDVLNLDQKELRIFRGGSNQSFKPSQVDAFAPSNEENYVDLSSSGIKRLLRGRGSSQSPASPSHMSQNNNFSGSGKFQENQDNNYFSYGNHPNRKNELFASPEFAKKTINMADFMPANIKSLDLDTKVEVLFKENEDIEDPEELNDIEEAVATGPVLSLKNSNMFERTPSREVITHHFAEEDPQNSKNLNIDNQIRIDQLIQNTSMQSEILSEKNSEEEPTLSEIDILELKSEAKIDLEQLEFLRKLSVNNIGFLRKDVEQNLVEIKFEVDGEAFDFRDLNRSKSFNEIKLNSGSISVELEDVAKSEGRKVSAQSNQGRSEELYTIEVENSEEVEGREVESSYATGDFEFSESRVEGGAVSLNLGEASTQKSRSVKSEQPELRFASKTQKKSNFGIENNLGEARDQRKEQYIISSKPFNLDDRDTVHRVWIDSIGKGQTGFAKMEEIEVRENQLEKTQKTDSNTYNNSEAILIEGLDQNSTPGFLGPEMKYSLESDLIQVGGDSESRAYLSEGQWRSGPDVESRKSETGRRVGSQSTDETKGSVFMSQEILRPQNHFGLGEEGESKEEENKEEKEEIEDIQEKESKEEEQSSQKNSEEIGAITEVTEESKTREGSFHLIKLKSNQVSKKCLGNLDKIKESDFVENSQEQIDLEKEQNYSDDQILNFKSDGNLEVEEKTNPNFSKSAVHLVEEKTPTKEENDIDVKVKEYFQSMIRERAIQLEEEIKAEHRQRNIDESEEKSEQIETNTSIESESIQTLENQENSEEETNLNSEESDDSHESQQIEFRINYISPDQTLKKCDIENQINWGEDSENEEVIDSPKIEETLKEPGLQNFFSKKVRPSLNFSKKRKEEVGVIEKNDEEFVLKNESANEDKFSAKFIHGFSDFSVTHHSNNTSHLIRTEMINRSLESSDEDYLEEEEEESEDYEDADEVGQMMQSEIIEAREHFSVEDMEMVDIIKLNKLRGSLSVSEEEEDREDVESAEKIEDEFSDETGDEIEDIAESRMQDETEHGIQNYYEDDNDYEEENSTKNKFDDETKEIREDNPINEEENFEKNLVDKEEKFENNSINEEKNDIKEEIKSEKIQFEEDEQFETSSMKLLQTTEQLGTFTLKTNVMKEDESEMMNTNSDLPESMIVEQRMNSKARTIKSMIVGDFEREEQLLRMNKSVERNNETESKDISVSNLVNEKKEWTIKNTESNSCDEARTEGVDYIEIKKRQLEEQGLRKSDNTHVKRAEIHRLAVSTDQLKNKKVENADLESMEEIEEEGKGRDLLMVEDLGEGNSNLSDSEDEEGPKDKEERGNETTLEETRDVEEEFKEETREFENEGFRKEEISNKILEEDVFFKKQESKIEDTSKRRYKESQENSVVKSNLESEKWDISTPKITSFNKPRNSSIQQKETEQSPYFEESDKPLKHVDVNESNLSESEGDSNLEEDEESDRASIRTQQKYHVKFEEKGTIKAERESKKDIKVIDSPLQNKKNDPDLKMYSTFNEKREKQIIQLSEKTKKINSSNLIEKTKPSLQQIKKTITLPIQTKIITNIKKKEKDSIVISNTKMTEKKVTVFFPSKHTTTSSIQKSILYLTESGVENPTSIENSLVKKFDSVGGVFHKSSYYSNNLKKSVVTFVNAFETDGLQNSFYMNSKQFAQKTTNDLPKREKSAPIIKDRGYSMNRIRELPSKEGRVRRQPVTIVRSVIKRVSPGPRVINSRRQEMTSSQLLYKQNYSTKIPKNLNTNYISRSQSPVIRHYVNRSVSYDHVKAKVSSRRVLGDPALKITRSKINFINRNIENVRRVSQERKRQNNWNQERKNDLYSNQTTPRTSFKHTPVVRKSRRMLANPPRKIVSKVQAGPKKSEKKYLQKMKKIGHHDQMMKRRSHLGKQGKRNAEFKKEKTVREIDLISENIRRSKSPQSRYYASNNSNTSNVGRSYVFQKRNYKY